MTDCIICNNPIPPGRHPQTNVCSDACWLARRRLKIQRKRARTTEASKLRQARKNRRRRAQTVAARIAAGNFKCVVCGADISHLSSLARVCSRVCAKVKSHKQPRTTIRPCIECGTMFAGGGPGRTLCSPECRNKRKKRLRKRRTNPEASRECYQRNRERYIEQKRTRRHEFIAALAMANSLLKDQ
jgi:predicted nucleic acid-binding Zn ribbon protein